MALNFKNIQAKLGKLSGKVRAKDSDGEEIEVEVIEDQPVNKNDKTASQQVDLSEVKSKKPRIKSIQILIIILLALFLLIDDEWLSSKNIPLISKSTQEQGAKDLKDDLLEAEPSTDNPENSLEENSETSEITNNIEATENTEIINEPQVEDKIITDDLKIAENKVQPEAPEIPKFTDNPDQEESFETTSDLDSSENSNIDQEVDDDKGDSLAQTDTETKPVSEMSDNEILEKINSGGPSEEEASFNEIEVANEIIENSGADKLLSQIEKELKQEKILQKDLNYKIKNKPAPLYQVRGPALVRNCVDGHWACIDAPAYKQCKANLEWTKDKGKNIQCYPHEIFATLKDCELAQDKIMEDSLKGLEVCQN